MKKPTALLLALCLCLASCVMLASCDDDTSEHTHAYKTEWATDATHHWHVCEGEGCTEVADKAEHTWNAGEITTPATHDAQGVKTYTCTACAATKTEAVQGDFTVTAEEWAYALDYLFNYDNFTYTSTGVQTMTGNNPMAGEYEVAYTVQKNGTDVLWIFELDGVEMQRMFFFVYGDKYYGYEESYPTNWQDASYWIDAFENHEIFAYDDFAYNVETGAYEAASFTFESDALGSKAVYYTDCTLKFLDGKLVGLSATATTSMDGMNIVSVQNITITYGTAPVVEIPANLHRPS